MINKTLSLLLLWGALFSFGGCGSGGDNDNFESPEVTDMDLEDETIAAGEGTVLAVEFSFDRANIFDDNDEVVVVVRLPNGITYREGTAEIDEDAGGDNDISPEITLCSDGTTFLRFSLDENDLQSAENPDGDGDARLTMTIDSLRSLGSVILEGRADENSAPFGCSGSFLAEDRVVLNVL